MAFDTEAMLGADIAKEKEAELFNSAKETIVSENYDIEQVKQLAKTDLNFLAGLAMPTVFRHLFPPVLLAAWQLITNLAYKVDDFSKLALGIPRGHAKTTLMKLFILYLILFTEKRFILIVSSTADLAENIIADIVDMLNEPNIINVFGNWRLALETDRTALKKFSFRKRPIILAAIGVGGSLRGLNIKNERPDVMLFEDIQTKEASESVVQSMQIERWMYGTAMKAKSPRGCLTIFCGNMYPGPNSILKKIKFQKSWIKFISGAILADGTALWEKLRSLKSLIEELDGDIEAGHPEVFFSEVLNDTDAGINSKVDFAQIRPWPYTEYDVPQGKFIIIDPSLGLGGDNTAIGYVEVYDGIPALRNVTEEQLSPGNTVRTALLWALRHGARAIIVESTAYQASLIYWFGVISDQMQITGFHFLEIYATTTSKNARIAAGLKALTAQEIYIHAEVRSQVLKQIGDWNPMKRNNSDGLLDLIAYCPKVVQLYAAEITCYDWNQISTTDNSTVDEDAVPF